MQESYGMEFESGQNPDERPLKVWQVRYQSAAYLVIARSLADAREALDYPGKFNGGFVLGPTTEQPVIDDELMRWLQTEYGVVEDPA